MLSHLQMLLLQLVGEFLHSLSMYKTIYQSKAMCVELLLPVLNIFLFITLIDRRKHTLYSTDLKKVPLEVIQDGVNSNL